MTQVPVARLIVAILAFSAAAFAQTGPEATPSTPPGTAVAPSTGTTGSSEWVPTPQPQPAQAQPQPGAPGAQAPGPPPSNAAPPPNTYSQPYASNSAVAANGGARDANNPNYQRNDSGSNQPYTGGQEEPKSKFEMPAWSVRLDPFNWLLAGRLGFELESQVWKFISVEMVPVFVVNDQPPYLNLGLAGVPDTLKQKSAGLGALAGASLGVGFWLNGKPMEGYVLRAEITNYSIDYTTSIDRVNRVEREFQVLFGQHSKWGPFTIAGTFGFGYALKKYQRCFTQPLDLTSVQTSGCASSKRMDLAVIPPDTNPLNPAPIGVINLNPWTYPIDLVLRISLGVAF